MEKKHLKLVEGCKSEQNIDKLITNSVHAKLENTVSIFCILAINSVL